MSGWIKISRRIVEMNGYFGEKFSRPMCWIDLILLAEWRAERVFYIRGNKVVVRRGQLAVSIEELGKRWNLAKLTVRNRLQEFVDDGRIDIQKSRVINIISIRNYEKYQSIDPQSDPQDFMPIDPQIDMQTDPQTNPQTDLPIKNINNINNNFNDDIGGAEKKFLDELKNSQSWLELMAMRFHLTIDEVKKRLNDFSLDQKCRGTTHRDINDMRKHFNDWLRIVISNEAKKQDNVQDREKSNNKRRGSDITATKAEDYEGAF